MASLAVCPSSEASCIDASLSSLARGRGGMLGVGKWRDC